MAKRAVFGKMKLPGFGLPVYWYPEDSDRRLNTALIDYSSKRPPLTVHEFQMTALMSEISEKPHWISKVEKPEVLEKWMSEALAEDTYLSEQSIQECFAELQHEAQKYERLGYMKAFNGGILKSDAIIPGSVQQALKEAVAPLENVPEELKDWHPGTDGKVLDLVHPSLFPVVYGKTRILVDEETDLRNFADKAGKGVTIPVPTLDDAHIAAAVRGSQVSSDQSFPETMWSMNYQWLPCDVRFEGDKAKIKSYINNLHPVVHKKLYDVIEDVLNAALPMFDRTITVLHIPDLEEPRIVCTGIEYPEGQAESDFFRQHRDLDGDEFDRMINEFHENRQPIQPQPAKFTPPDEGSDSASLNLRSFENGFQVIVKLANIELTPEKPNYDGGSWHVEGQMNEHIVATGIYYYDSENITDNTLEFRSQVDEETIDLNYEQSDFTGFEKMFGVGGEDSAVQVIGEVVTKGGRFITFPNVFQHCVRPFELQDKTKPGHRKILAFFLVDPFIRVISTANVPPQQRQWWASNIPSLPQVPQEIYDKIIDSVDDMMSLEDAKEERLKLMEERKVFVQAHDRDFLSIEFALCEH